MEKLEIVQDARGNKVVLIPDIIFTNKKDIDWDEVEAYLKRYVGEKMYLYDLVDIKKEASNPSKTTK